MLVLYIHILACLLNVAFGFEKTWIPAVDFIYAKTELHESGFWKKYLSMTYAAIMVFGLNEIAPAKPAETIAIIVMMICSAMVNAFIFGEMAVLV